MAIENSFPANLVRQWKNDYSSIIITIINVDYLLIFVDDYFSRWYAHLSLGRCENTGWCPPSYKLVYKPHKLVRYITNKHHSEIGVICTNWTLSLKSAINLMKSPFSDGFPGGFPFWSCVHQLDAIVAGGTTQLLSRCWDWWPLRQTRALGGGNRDPRAKKTGGKLQWP